MEAEVTHHRGYQEGDAGITRNKRADTAAEQAETDFGMLPSTPQNKGSRLSDGDILKTECLG